MPPDEPSGWVGNIIQLFWASSHFFPSNLTRPLHSRLPDGPIHSYMGTSLVAEFYAILIAPFCEAQNPLHLM
jgi:hypothetical protein